MIKWILRAAAALILLAVLVGVAWQVSPWPSAMMYRMLFDKGGIALDTALAGHVPTGVSSTLDLRYGPAREEVLDINRPEGDAVLPAILWIHGGGFISGDKSQLANYLKILASNGYAVVGINYTLAPAAQHPVPTRQANAALAYIVAHAKELRIDPSRLVLAGDSAGAQIAAQLGIALSDPAYAAALGLAPAAPVQSVKGLVLACGVFDPVMLNGNGTMAGFVRTVAWSYFGNRDLSAVPPLFSVAANLPAAMPPLFITAGNADPLLAQSQALAERAAALGVSVDPLFFPLDYNPPLPHEYELNLDTEAGQLALSRTMEFLARVTR